MGNLDLGMPGSCGKGANNPDSRITQRRPSTRSTGSSRSPGMSGRDQSERPVAIDRNTGRDHSVRAAFARCTIALSRVQSIVFPQNRGFLSPSVTLMCYTFRLRWEPRRLEWYLFREVAAVHFRWAYGKLPDGQPASRGARSFSPPQYRGVSCANLPQQRAGHRFG